MSTYFSGQIPKKIIGQYKSSPLLISFIQSMLLEADAIKDEIDNVTNNRTVANATGVQLDIIGAILGIDRAVVDFIENIFFGFIEDPTAQSFGDINDALIGGRFRSSTENAVQARQLNDNEYRAFIFSKISKNSSDITPDEVLRITSSILSVIFEGGESIPVNVKEIYGSIHNLLTFSEDYTDAIWAKLNASIVIDSSVGPEGITNGSLLQEANTFGTHFMNRVGTEGAGEYVFSFYAKSSGRNEFLLEYEEDDPGVVNRSSIFDLDAISVSDGSVTVPGGGGILADPSGWIRCWIYFTAGTGVNSKLTVQLFENGSNIYQGDGISGIEIWGAQLENTSRKFPGQYVKTDSVAAQQGQGASFEIQIGAILSGADQAFISDLDLIPRPAGVRISYLYTTPPLTLLSNEGLILFTQGGLELEVQS